MYPLQQATGSREPILMIKNLLHEIPYGIAAGNNINYYSKLMINFGFVGLQCLKHALERP